MEFTSARFAGNPVLEEILNDPNTGTKKLAKYSPPDAVTAVQRALLDLRWVGPYFQTPEGGTLLQHQFVDGDYGGWTTAVVLDYKRHYDIHFPPDAPEGFIDGFTGPATLKSLDKHCTLLDEAHAVLTQHAQDLLNAGAVESLLTQPDGVGRTTTPIRQSAGAYLPATINGLVGSVIYKRNLGAFAIWGPLFVEWVTQEQAEGTGASTGQVGFPLSDMFVADPVTSVQVERGTITFDAGVGAATVDVDPALAVLRHDIEF